MKKELKPGMICHFKCNLGLNIGPKTDNEYALYIDNNLYWFHGDRLSRVCVLKDSADLQKYLDQIDKVYYLPNKNIFDVLWAVQHIIQEPYWEKEEEPKEVTMEELNKMLKDKGLPSVKIKE